MKYIITILLFLYCYGVVASENKKNITEAITSLGLLVNDFNQIWPNSCKPHWKNSYEGNLIEINPKMKVYRDTFFIKISIQGGRSYLSPGEKCKALHNYYFYGTNSEVIKFFIEKDKKIIELYDFSSLDLFSSSENYFESYNTYKKSNDDILYLEKLIERHKKKGTFTVTKEIKSTAPKKVNGKYIDINVDPYVIYFLSPSKEMKEAHGKINS